MTLAELYTELNKICKTAKGRFREPVEPPFILYLDESAESISGDYVNLGKRNFISIDLASDVIDKEKESRIENILTEYEYTKTRFFVESEKLWQTTYEFVIIEEV